MSKADPSVSRARTRTAEALTPHLHRLAARHGWPDELVSELSVKHHPVHGFYADYPDDLSDIVAVREFGDPENEPRPALRQFANRVELWGGKVHEAHLLHEMTREGVL